MKRRFPILSLWIVLALLGLALAGLAQLAGAELGARFSEAILRAGRGKISDPSAFVSGRLFEAGALMVLGALLGFASLGARRIFSGRRHAWAALALALFAAANFWLWAAGRTAAFWACFYTGQATANFTQFQFKKLLLPEHRAQRQLLLLGSSQTQAQLDENRLNTELSGMAWSTELHFPGSHGLDLLLVLRRLRGSPGEDLVCYLSEYYFYSGLYSTTPPYFFRAQDWPVLSRLGWSRELRAQPFGMGLLGQFLPVFAFREPFSHRLLGTGMASLEQKRYDADLETNLIRRAEVSAEAFRLDGNAALQKAAFDEFVREAGRQNRRLILLEGSVNPLLAERLPGNVRRDYRAYLRQLAAEHRHVRLVPAEVLPKQSAESYDDLTHVTRSVQQDFSQWFAGYYKEQLAGVSEHAAALSAARRN